MDSFLSQHTNLILSGVALVVGFTASIGNLKIRSDLLSFKERLLEQLDKRYASRDVNEILHVQFKEDLQRLKEELYGRHNN